VEAMVNQLYEDKIRVFYTGRDGAIQWNPDKDTRSPI
jgi:competence protein ComEC